jgi:uncharacterized protein (TIGR04255 family)
MQLQIRTVTGKLSRRRRCEGWPSQSYTAKLILIPYRRHEFLTFRSYYTSALKRTNVHDASQISPYFEPLYQAHAIGEMVVFFEFEPSIEPAYGLLLELKHKLASDLPKFSLEQEHHLDLAAATPALRQTLPAMVFQRFRSDGNLEWMLRTSQNTISIHCLAYTRWEEVWARCQRYADMCFERTNRTPIQLTGIGLKYIDQFYFRGPQETYDASLLFKKDSPLLHRRSFESGLRWHCHTGWFKLINGHECLSQLNVTSGQGKRADGEDVVAVAIDHTLMIRVPAGPPLTAYSAETSGDNTALSRLMTLLHNENKRVLIDLLTDSMAQRISLKMESL